MPGLLGSRQTWARLDTGPVCQHASGHLPAAAGWQRVRLEVSAAARLLCRCPRPAACPAASALSHPLADGIICKAGPASVERQGPASAVLLETSERNAAVSNTVSVRFFLGYRWGRGGVGEAWA